MLASSVFIMAAKCGGPTATAIPDKAPTDLINASSDSVQPASQPAIENVNPEPVLDLKTPICRVEIPAGVTNPWQFATDSIRTLCGVDVTLEQVLRMNFGWEINPNGGIYDFFVAPPQSGEIHHYYTWSTAVSRESGSIVFARDDGVVVGNSATLMWQALTCNGTLTSSPWQPTTDDSETSIFWCDSFPENEEVIAFEANDTSVATIASLAYKTVGYEFITDGAVVVLSRVFVLASIATLLSSDAGPELLGPPLTAASLSEAVWMSTRHGSPLPGWGDQLGNESEQVIKAALTAATVCSAGYCLHKKGDGHSNGSVRIYAGVDATNRQQAHVAVLLIVNKYVWFTVLSAPVRPLGYLCPPGGCIRIDSQSFFNPKDLLWNCAWILSNKDWNGHGASPESTWLEVGQGWQWWEATRAKYSPLYEITEIPLPDLRPENLFKR